MLYKYYKKKEIIKKEEVIKITYLSHALNVQLAIINNERIKTNKTVPGHIVINVFNTNLVLNLILLKAPILLDEASITINILKN